MCGNERNHINIRRRPMYKILIDSCGELPQELKEDGHFSNVALVLEVDGKQIVDDETFDQADFLKRVAEKPLPLPMQL